LLRTPEEMTIAQDKEANAGADPLAGLGKMLGPLAGAAGGSDPTAALSGLAGAAQAAVDPNAAIPGPIPAMAGPAKSGGGNV